MQKPAMNAKTLLKAAKSERDKFPFSESNIKKGVILIFADFSGSTKQGETNLTEVSVKATLLHNFILRLAFTSREVGGELIKEIGDEVMIRIDSKRNLLQKRAVSVVKAAVIAQKAFDEYNKSSDVRNTPANMITTRISIYKTEEVYNYYPNEPKTVPDMLGREVNRAARIMGVAEGGQIVVSESLYRLIGNKDRRILQEKHGIGFSDKILLRGLRNIGKEIPIREVLWDGRQSSIDENRIHALVLLEVNPDKNIGPDRVLKAIKACFKTAKCKKNLLCSHILLGKRAIALRTKAPNLEDHRKMMMNALNVKGLGMAHSFFLHWENEKPQHPDETVLNGKKAGALVLYNLTLNGKTEAYKNFLDNLKAACAQKKGRGIHLHDAGTVFGDREAYAILAAPSYDLIQSMIFKQIFDNTKLSGVTRYDIIPLMFGNR